MIDVSLTQFTIVDFCEALKRGDIHVNREYQRSPQVWPVAARSFLIETMLLGYPIPKLYLSQITDIKTRSSRKEIVDGQQRTMAIQDFFENNFKLSRNALPDGAAGKAFNDLSDDLKGTFLSYRLTADVFVGATKAEIREMFRRMNSYTIPLNAEERRHAVYQGEFKWFIYRLAKKYSQAFEDMGVFTEKALARMADTKLLSELCHGLVGGITTTKDRDLSKLYEDYDADFPEERQLERRLTTAIDNLIELQDIHNSALMKPHQVYGLLLALAHSKSKVPSLESAFVFSSTKRADPATMIQNLTKLEAALEQPGMAPRALKPFLDASRSKTNVGEQRRIRFQWMCKALQGGLE